MKPIYRIFLLVVLLFILGGSLTWYNPRPGFVPAYRISDKIPFLWQFDTDTRLFLNASILFPRYWGAINQEIGRPVYPLIGKIFSMVVDPVFSRFFPGTDPYIIKIGGTALGFMLFSFSMFFLFGILGYRFLQKYLGLDDSSAFLAIAIILTSAPAMKAAGTYHTFFAQIACPSLILIMFHDACSNYSFKKLAAYSLISGIFILIKPLYVIVAAISCFLLLKREFKKFFWALSFFMLPIIMWSIVLSFYGFDMSGAIPFLHKELVVYVSGYRFSSLSETLETLDYMLQALVFMLQSIVSYFFIWSFMAVWMFVELYRENKLGKNELIFVCLFLVFLYLQGCYTWHMQRPYLVGDIGLIVMGLGIIPWMQITRRWVRNDNLIIAGTLIIWILINIAKYLHVPWIHPYDQITGIVEKLS